MAQALTPRKIGWEDRLARSKCLLVYLLEIKQYIYIYVCVYINGFFMGKSSIHAGFSIGMFDYQRLNLHEHQKSVFFSKICIPYTDLFEVFFFFSNPSWGSPSTTNHVQGGALQMISWFIVIDYLVRYL